MKIEILVLLAVVFVASGCASNSTDSQDQNSNTTPQGVEEPDMSLSNISENATVITYTSSGFQPSEVTIEQGDTVVWNKEGSRPMWVGSDRHPVHSQYSGSSLQEHCSNGDQNSRAFDQCSTGDRFSFTFEKSGEWNYHNHQYSTHTGKVIVE